MTWAQAAACQARTGGPQAARPSGSPAEAPRRVHARAVWPAPELRGQALVQGRRRPAPQTRGSQGLHPGHPHVQLHRPP